MFFFEKYYSCLGFREQLAVFNKTNETPRRFFNLTGSEFRMDMSNLFYLSITEQIKINAKKI